MQGNFTSEQMSLFGSMYLLLMLPLPPTPPLHSWELEMRNPYSAAHSSVLSPWWGEGLHDLFGTSLWADIKGCKGTEKGINFYHFNLLLEKVSHRAGVRSTHGTNNIKRLQELWNIRRYSGRIHTRIIRGTRFKWAGNAEKLNRIQYFINLPKNR